MTSFSEYEEYDKISVRKYSIINTAVFQLPLIIASPERNKQQHHILNKYYHQMINQPLLLCTNNNELNGVLLCITCFGIVICNECSFICHEK